MTDISAFQKLKIYVAMGTLSEQAKRDVLKALSDIEATNASSLEHYKRSQEILERAAKHHRAAKANLRWCYVLCFLPIAVVLVEVFSQ